MTNVCTFFYEIFFLHLTSFTGIFIHKIFEPIGIAEILKMLAGLGMAFFGGFFLSTMAVIDALDQCGFNALVKNLSILWEQAVKVIEFNDLNDSINKNNDDNLDVSNLNHGKLNRKKALLILRSCDPSVLGEAINNIYTIFVGTMATLNIRFVRVISLGSSIGNILGTSAWKIMLPMAKHFIPPPVAKVC